MLRRAFSFPLISAPLAFLLLAFSAPDAAHALEPLWYAAPPIGVVHQPIQLGLLNKTPASVYLYNEVWRVEDNNGATVASFRFALQGYLPLWPGALFPGGWTPLDSGDFRAIATWYRQVSPGNYSARHDTVAVHVYGGRVLWTVTPSPVPQNNGSNSSTITLTLTNGSENPIWLSSTAPWYITDEAGNQVYTPGSATVWTRLLPGGSKVWPWDMKVTTNSYLAPGRYVANIRVYDQSGGTSYVLLQYGFTVTPVPAGAVVWRVTPLVQTTHAVVSLSLTNATLDKVCLSCLGPWQIEDAQGNVVYKPMSCQMIDTVRAGHSRVWGWDERDTYGKAVSAGRYVARIGWYNCITHVSGSATFSFDLVDPPQAQPSCEFLDPAGTYFAPGTTVGFDFTNCMPDTVIMPCHHAWWVTNEAGIPVQSAICLWVLTAYAPNAGFTDSWDQTDFEGEQVRDGAYDIWATFSDKFGATHYAVASDPIFIQSTSGVPGTSAGAGSGIRAVPNPLGSTARLRFQVPVPGTSVQVRVFDVAGRRVGVTDLGWLPAGPRSEEWLARSDDGRPLPAGIYLIQVRVGSTTHRTKVVVNR